MSLILDALKKAEADRRRAQPTSTVTNVTTGAQPRARRSWLFGLLVLCGLGGGTLLVWWLHSRTPAAAPVDSARVTAGPSLVGRPQENEPAGPSLVIPPPLPPVTATEPEAKPEPPLVTLAPPKPAAVEAPKTVPSLRELAPADRTRLPEINLQLHFFTADPGRRLVRINGTNLHEGEAVGGLRVIRIDPADVVLAVGALEFSLSAGRP